MGKSTRKSTSEITTTAKQSELGNTSGIENGDLPPGDVFGSHKEAYTMQETTEAGPG